MYENNPMNKFNIIIKLVGSLASSLFPIPNLPWLLYPKTKHPLSLFNTTVWRKPTEIWETSPIEVTSLNGTSFFSQIIYIIRRPSCPFKFDPKAQTLPFSSEQTECTYYFNKWKKIKFTWCSDICYSVFFINWILIIQQNCPLPLLPKENTFP